jgi:hypothetical protein
MSAMSEDIVARLRAGGDAMVRIDGPLKREAADEIERLRGIEDAAKKAADIYETEIERLRASELAWKLMAKKNDEWDVSPRPKGRRNTK